MKERNVVITGYSLSTSAGDETGCVFENWKNETANFSEQALQLGPKVHKRYIGLCAKPNVKKLPNKKVQKVMTGKDVRGLLMALEACEHAGIESNHNLDPTRLGMYVGASSTTLFDLEPYNDLVKKSLQNGRFSSEFFGENLMSSVNPMVLLKNLMNNTLCYATAALNFKGVNGNLMDFQLAGLKAIGEGFHAIKQNRADVMLVGGVSNCPDPLTEMDAMTIGYVLDPSKNSEDNILVRPFDQKRGGSILGEGASFLILEDEDHAKARGAKILGRLHSYATFRDFEDSTAREAESEALGRCITRVFNDRDFNADECSMIMSYGNGSVYGDISEALTYNKYLPKPVRHSPISTIKSVTGETYEASGPISLVMGIESLSQGYLPKVANLSSLEDRCQGLNILSQASSVKKGRGVITGQSVNGCYAALSFSV